MLPSFQARTRGGQSVASSRFIEVTWDDVDGGTFTAGAVVDGDHVYGRGVTEESAVAGLRACMGDSTSGEW
jgi:hypothetical protein